MNDLISRQAAIAALEKYSEHAAIYIVKGVPTVQPITENGLIELQDRYGDEVRFVVEDMLSGKEKRWTT